MIKEATGFGNDISEAQENARINLGVSADADVHFEIISQSKKKVLGLFGGSKAEVRAYIEVPDAPQKRVKASKNGNNKKSQNKPVQKKAEEKPVNKEEKPAVKEEPQVKTTAKSDFADLLDESKIPADSKTGKAIAYIKTVVSAFGCTDITVKAVEKENCAYILLDGEGLGIIIGRRGETLDALQYLAGLAANAGGGYFKVSLNIGDYRERRERALIELAEKVAKQVLETGRSRALEPMNPNERRIIHTAIQNIEGVTSNSTGDGKGRRVVVFSENGDSKPPRINDRRRGGKSGRGRGGNRPDNTVATTPTREPKKDSDMPLYGKIN